MVLSQIRRDAGLCHALELDFVRAYPMFREWLTLLIWGLW